MADLSITTTEQIRACLGITQVELDDEALEATDIAVLVDVALDSVYPDHVQAMLDATAPGASPAQLRLARLLQLFAAYEASVQLAPTFQFLLAQKITDGDAEVQRFNKDNLEETVQAIAGQRDKVAAILNPTLYSLDSFPVLGLTKGTPVYDPVTNEGTI